ncbi:MAG: hypothetical protein OEM28_12525 [Nitrosopumilus sp.]|nr:hypothetical protein [Nitrosopumilus sp.]MDH3488391.1 hypothetical protein [Nitrosopumilus sp.]
MKSFNKCLIISTIFLASMLIISGMNLGYAQTNPNSDGRNVKTIAVVTLVEPDRIVPKQKTGTFSYIFEACAGISDILSPEVLVTSDSESKKIKLSHKLDANQCQVSVSKVKSSSKDTISAVLIDRGGMTKIVKDLESQILQVKEKIKVEKSNLKMMINEKPQPADADKKISEVTAKIVKLRMDLNNIRENYFRTLYLLYN